LHRLVRFDGAETARVMARLFEISELQSINHRRIVTANGPTWIGFSDECAPPSAKYES
jgi:hypothetical protein